MFINIQFFYLLCTLWHVCVHICRPILCSNKKDSQALSKKYKGRAPSAVSHRLKTPLQSLRSACTR